MSVHREDPYGEYRPKQVRAPLANFCQWLLVESSQGYEMVSLLGAPGGNNASRTAQRLEQWGAVCVDRSTRPFGVLPVDVEKLRAVVRIAVERGTIAEPEPPVDWTAAKSLFEDEPADDVLQLAEVALERLTAALATAGDVVTAKHEQHARAMRELAEAERDERHAQDRRDRMAAIVEALRA